MIEVRRWVFYLLVFVTLVRLPTTIASLTEDFYYVRNGNCVTTYEENNWIGPDRVFSNFCFIMAGSDADEELLDDYGDDGYINGSNDATES